jgi:hypothetical protein
MMEHMSLQKKKKLNQGRAGSFQVAKTSTIAFETDRIITSTLVGEYQGISHHSR